MIGSVLLVTGMLLLWRLNADTGLLYADAAMVGAGLGLNMQTVVLAMQNTMPRDVVRPNVPARVPAEPDDGGRSRSDTDGSGRRSPRTSGPPRAGSRPVRRSAAGGRAIG